MPLKENVGLNPHLSTSGISKSLATDPLESYILRGKRCREVADALMAQRGQQKPLMVIGRPWPTKSLNAAYARPTNRPTNKNRWVDTSTGKLQQLQDYVTGGSLSSHLKLGQRVLIRHPNHPKI
ncbi:hypothetical protein K1T71_007260 [Dendrolimus kikuchii]|uniref:Uncharacterized protein n=1 Tax=Dendrolimus kikuchii TaxID=765133 RepID=A0ACC1D064_9NEOP|nr:hypothetical protein K1T71_007260 [Dendrolimus kikuchii]